MPTFSQPFGRAPAHRGSWFDAAVAGALAAITLALVVPALGTSSLWRDDAWTALTMKTRGLPEFLLVAVNAPGFSALLKGWLALVGLDGWKVQLLPLLFAVATPPSLYFVLVRAGLARVGAAAGALLLAVSPEFLMNATRIKQYTLDALVAVCLLGVAWWLLDDIASPRRWRVLALAGGIGLVLSSPSIVYLVAGVGTALVTLLRRGGSHLRSALLPFAAVAGIATAWYVFVLAPALSPTLTLFWQDSFIPLDEGPRQALVAGFVALDRFLEGMVPLGTGKLLPLLLAVGCVVAYAVVLVRRPPVGLLLFAPLAVAVVLAMLERAPLGTDRTDTYLYPAVFAAVAVAVDAGVRRAPRTTTLVALAGAAALLVAATTPMYRLDDVSPLVAEVEAHAEPSAAIVVYPLAAYQYALYTSLPVDFRRTSATATGFRVDVRRPNTFVVTEAWPHDLLHFANAVARLGPQHDDVWVVVAAPDERAVPQAAPAGATEVDRFRHRRDAMALPFALRALRRAYGVDEVSPALREVTVQQYVEQVLHRAGYRLVAPVRARSGATLSRWLRDLPRH